VGIIKPNSCLSRNLLHPINKAMAYYEGYLIAEIAIRNQPVEVECG
jgi:hypothetical protein